MIRVQQWRDKCIGCNACVEADKFRWRLSRQDGKCTLIGGQVKKGIHTSLVMEDEWEALQNAARNCPVHIIRIEKVS